MNSPRTRNAGRSRLRDSIRGLGVLALVTSACISLPGSEARRQAEIVRESNALAASLAALEDIDPLQEGLRVRLVFGETADLDLYVTDPLQETVYFANNPTRSGGSLDIDARCGAAGLRVETVTFVDPPPGRYRIGVDFPERCDGRDRPVPFLVTVQHGSVRREQRGTIPLQRFQPIVLEEDLPGN
jgi:hypothetical protein